MAPIRNVLFPETSRLKVLSEWAEWDNIWQPDTIMLSKIENRSQLIQVRRVQINHPGIILLCVVSIKKRDMIFNLWMDKPAYILFFPFDDKEVQQVFNLLLKEKELDLEKRSFFSGLEFLRQNYTWRTASIDITIIAAHFSRLFRQYNLCRNEWDEANFRLGLEEVLVNSVEHGNLELRSEEKLTGGMEEDCYEENKKKRYLDPRYNQRKLYLELEISRGIYRLSVTDEGPGFDVSEVQDLLNGKIRLSDAEVGQPGGKGFWFIKKIFPFVKFSEEGRKIILSNEEVI